MRRRCSCSLSILCFLVALVVAGAFSGVAQAQVVGNVTADYFVTDLDNTALHITNTSSAPLTSVVIIGNGFGPLVDCPIFTVPATGIVGQRVLGTIAPGATRDFIFDGSEDIFARSFATAFHGGATYQLLAVTNGILVGATFSPYANASGGFVPFLGNDINGCNLHAATGPTLVANIATVPCTPALALQILEEVRRATAFTLPERRELQDVLAAAAGSTGKTRCAFLRCALCLLRDVQRTNPSGSGPLSAQLEAVIRCLLASGC